MMLEHVARLVLCHHRYVLILVLSVGEIDSLGSCTGRLVAGWVMLHLRWFEDTNGIVLCGRVRY